MAFLFWPITILLTAFRFFIGCTVCLCCFLTIFATFFGNHSWLWNLATHFRVQYLWVQMFALAFATWDFFRQPVLKQKFSFFSPALLTRWINLVVLMVSAGLNLSFVAPLYRHSTLPPTGRETTRLRWMHINLLGKYNRQTEATITLLKSIHPDVLDLVEYTPAWNLRLERAGVLKRFPYRYVVPNHLALYSRYPIQNPRLIYPPGFRSIPNQGYVAARLRLPTASPHVILAHPASPMNEQHWKWHSALFRHWVYTSRQWGSPVLLVGDLNTSSWSPDFIQLLSKTPLRDSQEGFGPQPSWPAFWPSIHPHSKPPFWLAPTGLPIDHILTSPGIYVTERRLGPFIGSDHRPIWADLLVFTPASPAR